jgi:hypothetical protein
MTFKKGNKVNETHGMRHTKEYRSWYHAKQRCTNPNHIGWDLYGGRGIRMCEQWLNSFAQFYKDMGPKPGPRYSLDRIDTNGGYAPANCRWATPSTQTRNSRRNVVTEKMAAEIRASKLSHREEAARWGITYASVWDIRHGRSWA